LLLSYVNLIKSKDKHIIFIGETGAIVFFFIFLRHEKNETATYEGFFSYRMHYSPVSMEFFMQAGEACPGRGRV
jgi:hypothetical protein